MKRIGILGGMSWESTELYYRLINEGARDRLGGLHSADLLVRSVDFADVAAHFDEDDWDGLGTRMAAEARALQDNGAELILIATNTVHRVAERVERDLDVPLLHIADALALAALERGITRVVLLGTRFTMSQPFYADRLRSHGVDSVAPDPTDQTMIDDIIFGELVLGRFSEASRARVRGVIESVMARTAGVDGIALACTELELLLTDEDAAVPLLASSAIHVTAALDAAIAP